MIFSKNHVAHCHFFSLFSVFLQFSWYNKESKNNPLNKNNRLTGGKRYMSNKTRTLRIFGMILLVITQLILISYMASGSPASSLTYIDLEIVVLNEINAAPTDITLTGNIVEMVNSANGTVVGTLHTTDPNADDSHDYMLIDNAEGRFHVVDDEVIVNDSTKLSVGTYSITVRSTDLLGEYYDKVFLITVQDTVLEVTTWGAGNISSVGALLIGHVNPKNISTTVTFEYGTDTSYGTVVTADQSPVSGSVISSVGAEITGLMPGTTYHFRVNGVNAGGSASGMDKTFTTLQLTAAPTATVTTNNGTKKRML